MMMCKGMTTTMATLNLQQQPQPPSSNKRAVVFTTPQNYAPRLSHLLHLKGFRPVWCPTILVQTTPLALAPHLSTPNPNPNPHPILPLHNFSAIAFTSRTGITAFSQALELVHEPPFPSSGETIKISALGKDAELLDSAFINRLCNNSRRIEVLVPPISTPTGLVESLGFGRGRNVLCPVPAVVDLAEPPVVPNLLRDLASKGWVPTRVNIYETRWMGPGCAKEVVRRGGDLDAVVFTSTGEVEGLLKSLRENGLEWGEVRKRWPELVVAAHGPVTADGAERLGVGVDVVSTKFDSFGGVVDALAERLLGR